VVVELGAAEQQYRALPELLEEWRPAIERNLATLRSRDGPGAWP
jgi:hypothetical protein